jgi:hypothetical protein
MNSNSTIPPAAHLERYSIVPVGVARQTPGTAWLPGCGTVRLQAPGVAADVVLDYGRTQVGRISLTVRGRGMLRLRYGEDLEEAQVIDDPYAASSWYALPKEDVELTGGIQALGCSGRRAWRFLTLHLDAGGECEVLGLRAEGAQAPFNVVGSFNCSDPDLERIWEISEHTLRLCRQRYIEDGVKRDGLLWAGDYRVAFLASILLDPDPALPAACLRMMAASRRPDGRLPACAIRGGGGWSRDELPYLSSGLVDPNGFLGNWVLVNYEADFVASLYEYALYTGDLDLVDKLWPEAKDILAGVIATDLSTLPDEARMIDLYTDTRPDIGDMIKLHAALEMQVAEALLHAGRLAGLLGDEAGARHYQVEYRRRVDTWKGERRSAALANWNPLDAAILAEALAGGYAGDTIADLRGRGVQIPRSGFAAFWHFTALWKLGHDRLAMEHLKSWYAPMLKSRATTTWEVSQPEWDRLRFRRDIPPYSHAHSWSAGPCWLFPAYILGIQPITPGFGEVRVAPQASGLEWARGTVPTPHGPIELELDFSQARGRVVLPESVTARLPDGEGCTGGRESIFTLS